MFFQKGIDIYLVYGTDKEASEFFNKIVPESNFKMEQECSGSWAYSGKPDIPVYMLRVSTVNYLNTRTIAHECMHMVQHIVKFENIEDDEFPALFIGWLVEEFINWNLKITNKEITSCQK